MSSSSSPFSSEFLTAFSAFQKISNDALPSTQKQLEILKDVQDQSLKLKNKDDANPSYRRVEFQDERSKNELLIYDFESKFHILENQLEMEKTQIFNEIVRKEEHLYRLYRVIKEGYQEIGSLLDHFRRTPEIYGNFGLSSIALKAKDIPEFREDQLKITTKYIQSHPTLKEEEKKAILKDLKNTANESFLAFHIYLIRKAGLAIPFSKILTDKIGTRQLDYNFWLDPLTRQEREEEEKQIIQNKKKQQSQFQTIKETVEVKDSSS